MTNQDITRILYEPVVAGAGEKTTESSAVRIDNYRVPVRISRSAMDHGHSTGDHLGTIDHLMSG